MLFSSSCPFYCSNHLHPPLASIRRFFLLCAHASWFLSLSLSLSLSQVVWGARVAAEKAAAAEAGSAPPGYALLRLALRLLPRVSLSCCRDILRFGPLGIKPLYSSVHASGSLIAHGELPDCTAGAAHSVKFACAKIYLLDPTAAHGRATYPGC